jgi:2-dehydro-3-deoxyphosphogluconate aldolase/(4S)-4-hydroxy-2-oxoglutarate aldolase
LGTGESSTHPLQRLLPLFTFPDASYAKTVGSMLENVGITHVEVTFRNTQAPAAIEAIRSNTGLTVVAGTVTTESFADEAQKAGAHFAVAPHVDENLIAYASSRGLELVPGIATPTEAFRARQAGARRLKVFPAKSLGGPGFLRALAAVSPEVSFLPSGGVGVEDLEQYLALPFVELVGGSWITAPESIADYESLRKEISALVQAVSAR